MQIAHFTWFCHLYRSHGFWLDVTMLLWQWKRRSFDQFCYMDHHESASICGLLWVIRPTIKPACPSGNVVKMRNKSHPSAPSCCIPVANRTKSASKAFQDVEENNKSCIGTFHIHPWHMTCPWHAHQIHKSHEFSLKHTQTPWLWPFPALPVRFDCHLPVDHGDCPPRQPPRYHLCMPHFKIQTERRSLCVVCLTQW